MSASATGIFFSEPASALSYSPLPDDSIGKDQHCYRALISA